MSYVEIDLYLGSAFCNPGGAAENFQIIAQPWSLNRSGAFLALRRECLHEKGFFTENIGEVIDEVGQE